MNAETTGGEQIRKRIMNKNSYKASMDLSFGQVSIELKPDASVKEQRQAFDAMLNTAFVSLSTWATEYTLDPQSNGGKQEKITRTISDGSRKIGELVVSVPTTTSYDKAMFEGLVDQTIIPDSQKAFRSFPSTYAQQQSQKPAAASSQQHLLMDEIVPDAIRHVSQVRPQQLQTR